MTYSLLFPPFHPLKLSSVPSACLPCPRPFQITSCPCPLTLCPPSASPRRYVLVTLYHLPHCAVLLTFQKRLFLCKQCVHTGVCAHRHMCMQRPGEGAHGLFPCSLAVGVTHCELGSHFLSKPVLLSLPSSELGFEVWAGCSGLL